MQFSIATIVSLLAASAVAFPVAGPAPLVDRAVVTVADVQLSADAAIAVKVAAGCDVLACLHDLAPTVATCATALAFAGLNPLANIACLAEIHSDIHTVPETCKVC